MAIAKRSNSVYTSELALNKRVGIEKEFAQQAFTVFREIKFGITPCCFVNYEDSVASHFISEWKHSSSNKTVIGTNVAGVFIEPLATVNDAASASCPTSPSNVCTIIELDSLINGGSTYTHCFNSPLQVVTITHNLGKFPSVTIVDGNNQIVTGQVDYMNSNVIQVTFSIPFSGCAFLN